MPASLLLHPFTLTVSGRVATADQGSDEYIDSQMRVVVGTRLGERQMQPAYGVPDPAFTELAVDDIQTCLDRYGPDGVRVAQLRLDQVDDSTQQVLLQWERTI